MGNEILSLENIPKFKNKQFFLSFVYSFLILDRKHNYATMLFHYLVIELKTIN